MKTWTCIFQQLDLCVGDHEGIGGGGLEEGRREKEVRHHRARC